MSRLVRGVWLAALLTAGAARADVFTLFIDGITPATGTPVKSWAMSLGPGSVAGKVNGSSITLSQDVIDAVMVHLLKAHARQTIIPTIVLEARRSASTPVTYRVTFASARVTALDVSDSGLATFVGSMQWSVKAGTVQLEQLPPAPPAVGLLKVEVE